MEPEKKVPRKSVLLLRLPAGRLSIPVLVQNLAFACGCNRNIQRVGDIQSLSYCYGCVCV